MCIMVAESLRGCEPMSLLAKFKYHVRQARMNHLNPYFILGRLLYVLHRRGLVKKLSPHGSRSMYIMAVSCGFRHESYLYSYFKIGSEEAFLDMGANVGLYPMLLAKKCKHVYAWEPAPKTFQELKENVSKLDNVTCYNVAVGRTEAKLPFNIHRVSGHSGFIFQAPDFTGIRILVPVKPIDSYCFPMKVGLIKVDTEGYEVPVIEGAMKTIMQDKPRLIIEIHRTPYLKEAEAIKKLLPNYRWMRVYKNKLRQERGQFHLVGDPR